MRIVLLSLFTLIAACTVRDRVDFVQDASSSAQLVPVLVATNRSADLEQPVPGWDRSADLGFGRYLVSLPSDREAGDIPRPRGGQDPDATRHFMIAQAQTQTAQVFRTELRQALRTDPNREAMVFVHGFNTNFVEGVFRTAQLDADFGLPGVMLHYSWPSLGVPLAYAYDRDSALFARDGLVEMIGQMRRAGASRTYLMAHSMGSHLVMEALRQMALTNDPALRTIAGVVLVSPDIDVELFRAQARVIGALPQPFLIVTSQRDRVLTLSAQLTGERARLGNLADTSALAGLDVTLVDVSAFSRGAGHFTAGSSPALIALLEQMRGVNRALQTDVSGNLPILPATILTLQNTSQVIVEPISGARPDGDERPPWWRRLISAAVRR